MSTGLRAAFAAIALTLALHGENAMAQPSMYGTSWVLVKRVPAEGTSSVCELNFAVLEPVSFRNRDAPMVVHGKLWYQAFGGVPAAGLKLAADLLTLESGKVTETPMRPREARLHRPSGTQPRILTSTPDEAPNAIFVVYRLDEAFDATMREAIASARLTLHYRISDQGDPWILDVELDVARKDQAGNPVRSRDHLAAFTHCVKALPLPLNPQ